MQYQMNTSSGLPVLDADGKRIQLSRSDSLSQALWFRLSRFRNEWKWDLDSGLPYNDWSDTPNPNLGAIRQTVRDELLKVKDAAAVNKLVVAMNGYTLNISAEVKCGDGTSVTVGI